MPHDSRESEDDYGSNDGFSYPWPNSAVPPAHQPGDGGKYGWIITERKPLHPGEPVFLLRAADPRAADAVIDYAERCRAAGCDESHVMLCYERAARIRQWQADHPELVKSKPD